VNILIIEAGHPKKKKAPQESGKSIKAARGNTMSHIKIALKPSDMMKNPDMIDIRKTANTGRIIRMPETTRKKVKAFLNEGYQLSF
jgi:hypothetical protein